MNSPPVVPVMKGGMREILVDFSKKQVTYFNNILMLLLVLGIIFHGVIPTEIANQADTVLGRLLLFVSLVILVEIGDMTLVILAAIFIGLLLSVSTRSHARTTREGFRSDHEIRIVQPKKLWWIEEVMKEDPIGIEDEKVRTVAVQDNSNPNSSSSSVQDTKSSNR